MALSYPLSLPTVKGAARIGIRAAAMIGMSVSPFSGARQLYDWQGDLMRAEVDLPPMKRANAEEWVGFLLSLLDGAGTFLMGDPVNTSPRGTWAGAPKVLGAHAARVKSIAMDGFTAAATVKVGDWIQQGSGSSAHLYKVVKDATADGSGLLTLEIWPRLREALADNDTFTTASPLGLWRLQRPEAEWTIERAQVCGLQFNALEALSV